MQIQDAIAASLMDENSFMSELKSLEAGLTSVRKASSPIEDHTERLTPGIDEVGQAIVHGPSLLWRMTAAAMFVLMMGVGAAGAAAVFHQRVARIVAAWQRQ